MSAISTYLHQIITAIWAKDVRQAIHDAISQCYDDVNAPALQTEAMQAAVQAKIDAGEMAALTIADGSLTGAKLADGTISTGKIANEAITRDKLSTDIEFFPEDAKTALLACFEHVAWADEHGQDYYDALESALYPDIEHWTYEWTYTDGLPDQNGLTLDQNGSANTISMTSEGLRVQVEDALERRVRYRYTSLPTDVQYTSGDYELEFKIVTYGSYSQAPYGNGVRMYAGMGDQTNWGTPKGLEIVCNPSGTLYLKTNVTNWSILDDTIQFATNTWYKVRIHQTLTQADVYVDGALVGSVPVADIKETVANPQFMAHRCSDVLFRAFRFRVFQ